MELYLPSSEYDLETVTSVLVSLVATAFVITATLFACFPDNKYVQNASKLFQKQQGHSKAQVSVHTTYHHIRVYYVCIYGANESVLILILCMVCIG
ncbi:hypothetical protein EON65_56095 [archaeon]|nr:MAG: hypothetical protein EON65_56095 [archaeon]